MAFTRRLMRLARCSNSSNGPIGAAGSDQLDRPEQHNCRHRTRSDDTSPRPAPVFPTQGVHLAHLPNPPLDGPQPP